MTEHRYALSDSVRVVIRDGEVSIQAGEVTAWGVTLGECFSVDREVRLTTKEFDRLVGLAEEVWPSKRAGAAIIRGASERRQS